ncbi:MAG: DegT/DnrJ/EryC1/StrS family aminotransferase [Nitrospinota bacterium]
MDRKDIRETRGYMHSLPSDADASGRTFGQEELELLRRVIESGTLNCTRGSMVRTFEEEFAEKYGVGHCTAVTSGTAALHTAVAAIDPSPGDEVITTPITDMGVIAAILYQTAVPVFADVDPETCNVTAETIEPRITPRTRAIIVTHLFGNPCDMDPILGVAGRHGLPVIEDCAQAYLATYKGRLVGTVGAIGCFSLQQTKHMSCGEGGMVITGDDALGRRMRLFHDKAWGYGDPEPDHYFLALNYRMTELQGAVALAQLRKLEGVVSRRRALAGLLTRRIAGVRGIDPPRPTPGATHVYWKYPLRVNAKELGADVTELAARLKEAGIHSSPRYIQKPAFLCEVLRERRTFGASRFPFEGPFQDGQPSIEYRLEDYPGTVQGLSGVLVLPWNERYVDADVEFIAGEIRRSVAFFQEADGG